MDNGNRLIGIDGKKPMILVVDDTPSNLVVISTIVEDEGGEVRVARNGPTALRLAQLSPRPDLILLDIMMPDMDGHMVLAELRKNPLTRDIPVIFVTAMNDPEEEERGISEGAADFVTKPVKPAVLIARVRAQIELSRAQQLLSSQKSWLEKEVARQVGENTRLENRLQLTWRAPASASGNATCSPGAIAGARACARSSAMPRSRHHRRLPGPGLPGRPPGRRRTTAGPKPSRRPGHAGRVPPAPSGWQLALGGSPQPQPRTRRRRPAPPDRRHPARHQCAQGQQAERQLADLVFTGISDGICITDAQRNILRINKAFSHITGYEPADAGQNPRLLRSGNHDHAFFRDMWEKLDRYDNWQGEIRTGARTVR
jgi:CheY-like chemotaxis protein